MEFQSPKNQKLLVLPSTLQAESPFTEKVKGGFGRWVFALQIEPYSDVQQGTCYNQN